ncbi:MAG TPA: pitrilysin family protein [Gemmatimonadales bacterium]|nr:pitrilysin family protein [Gemmatimonadales bacterium]
MARAAFVLSFLTPAFVAAGLAAQASPAAPARPAPGKGAVALSPRTDAAPSCARIRATLNARPAVKATRGATVEGITEYTLPNGLRVLLFPDQSKPTTTVNITYLVGSRHEGYGETGMAHLLEHMVFKGTPCHPNIPQELTAHGARPNGTTWFDRTNYFETFSASDSNLVWALDLESDRMVNSYIARKDLESEFTVVRNEFESGENDPFGVLMERTISAAYLWHNYGHSTIGARSDIENVPIERLQSFYHRYYQPDNAVLVVAGKFDPARTLSLIEARFGRIPRPDRRTTLKIYPTYTLDPVQDGERSVTLRRVGDIQVAMSVFHVPAGTHPDFAAVDVLSRVLGDAPSGRLYKALVEPKLAADVGAFDFQLREPGVVVTYARVRKEDDLGKARLAMDSALAAVLTSPPAADEVERAKTQLLKNIELTLNRSDQVGLQLSEWAAMGDWRLLFIHRDRLRKVTAEDVARVAAAYLKPSNMTTGTFIPTDKPDRAEIPPTPDVAELVKSYKGDTALAAGEVFDASPGNIDRRTTRSTLASGLKLVLLPKQNRGQSVNLALTLRFGTLDAVQGQSAAADLAADMLMRGTRNRTRQQIKDEFDRLKARVSPFFASPTQVRVTLETTRPNLVPALRLLGEVLREPAFPDKEFDELKREDLAQFEENRSEPTAQGSIAYQRYLNPYPKGDPRYVSTLDEQVSDYSAATLDDARRFYARFYGASDGELTVVGDFDPAELTAAATEVFGSWKSPQPFARVPQEFKDVAATSITLNTPDKANAFFLAGMNLRIRDDSPDYPALLLGNYMLGGGFLNSRLATRIRQKEGISYGVGSGLFASPLDSAGGFQTFAIYAPENAGRLEQAFREEIDRMLKEGFTAEEVKQAKTGWLQSRQVGRSQDAQLAGTLGGYAFIGRTLAFDAALESRVAALTPEAINAAMRKYIDPAKITIVKAGDFEKKQEPAKP